VGESTGTSRRDFYCILDESLVFDEALMFYGELRYSLLLGNMPLDSLWLNTKTMKVMRVIQTGSVPLPKHGADAPPQGLEPLPEEECALLRQNNTRFRCRFSRWENGNGRIVAQPVPFLDEREEVVDDADR
jgi:hypothetical protein